MLPCGKVLTQKLCWMLPTAGLCLPTKHKAQPRASAAGIFWHKEEAQHSILSIPNFLFTYTYISRQPTPIYKLRWILLMDKSHSPVPKKGCQRVTSTLQHHPLSTEVQHRTPTNSEIQFFSTSLFSNKALGTHLDLTFLKTSSTYSEGWNRGKTTALHIKKHSKTNMCLWGSFCPVKNMQSHLVRWIDPSERNKQKRNPFSSNQLPILEVLPP